MRFDGIIFDFDGVLIESEHVSTQHIAALLTALGHPTSYDEARAQFVGVGGPARVRLGHLGHLVQGLEPAHRLARPGHAAVLATAETAAIMRVRLGDSFAGTVDGTAVTRHWSFST